MNHHPDVSCDSEGGIPSDNPLVVSSGSVNLTADTDKTHKKVDKDGRGEGFHPDTRIEYTIYAAVRGRAHHFNYSFNNSNVLINYKQE